MSKYRYTVKLFEVAPPHRLCETATMGVDQETFDLFLEKLKARDPDGKYRVEYSVEKTA